MKELYENEEIRLGKGYPSLVRFFNDNFEKPLVVFFPGWAHLGRISYGFPGSKEEHFLAKWITQNGYPFLATSYPIDHPVYEEVYPEFTLTDWGNMAAEIVKQFIDEHRLLNDIIGISWSAAGQVVRPFNVACQSLGLNVDFHLVLESSPALLIPSDRTIGFNISNKHLVSVKDSHYNLFWREIEDQSQINGEEIISKEMYFRDFVGDFPVSLMGTNECYEDGTFVNNIEKSYRDKNFFAYTEYPIIASVTGNSKLAPYHPFVDRWTWGFLLTRKIYHDYISRNESSFPSLSKDKFNNLVEYVNDLPNRLHRTTQGNHFLFLGRVGAKRISEYLEFFDNEIHSIKKNFNV